MDDIENEGTGTRYAHKAQLLFTLCNFMNLTDKTADSGDQS